MAIVPTVMWIMILIMIMMLGAKNSSEPRSQVPGRKMGGSLSDTECLPVGPSLVLRLEAKGKPDGCDLLHSRVR